jgi:HD-GYP domain-containing protein (c-di-GMP phosphodiesterase class II)
VVLVLLATTGWLAGYLFRSPYLVAAAFFASVAGVIALVVPSAAKDVPTMLSSPAMGPAESLGQVSGVAGTPARTSASGFDEECESRFAVMAAKQTPASLDPSSVLRSYLDAASGGGRAMAAHLWIQDESSGRLSLVAVHGVVGPGASPTRQPDEIIKEAAEKGQAVLAPTSTIKTVSGASTIWRYAVPLAYSALSGVAAIDFSGDEAPDGAVLNRVSASMRLPLVCALGLHVADSNNAIARSLLEATRDLSQRLDPQDVIEAALDRAIALAEAATGSIMLFNDGDGRLSIAASEGLPEDVVRSTSASMGEGIAGWVAASRQPLLVEDLPGRSGRGQRHGVRSALSVPIDDDEGLLGVLNVGSRAYPATFTETHMEALEILGRQTAVALRNARALAATQSLYIDTLKALSMALESKDPFAMGGTERIMELTAALGREMELERDDQQALELAAVLHDIGMSAVANAGVQTPRPLTTVERGLLKMHPSIAAEILNSIPALKHVTPIVFHHHEHYNGAGYGSGASGDEIPLGARILAVTDAFVAMTSERPYRKAMDAAAALEELSAKAGTQFDPDVVQAIKRLLESGFERVPDKSL